MTDKSEINKDGFLVIEVFFLRYKLFSDAIKMFFSLSSKTVFILLDFKLLLYLFILFSKIKFCEFKTSIPSFFESA